MISKVLMDWRWREAGREIIFDGQIILHPVVDIVH
jgi:hypothetical protein